MGFRIVVAAAFWLALALPAAASGLVLIIANEHHQAMRDARGAAQVLALDARFSDAGFTVDRATDLAAPTMRAALASLSTHIERRGHERVIIVFAGYVLHSGQGAWLLGSDADSPDLARIDDAGVRLETALAVAATLQGGAIVAIADMGYPGRPGSGLAAGMPAQVTVPQGVTLVSGPVERITTFLRTAVRPGANLRDTGARIRGLQMQGFLPPYLAFLPEGHEPALDAERRAWERAADDDTAEAYQAFLDDYPDGTFTDEARAAIERLEQTPERIEDALNLSRDERRAIQRDLTLLGFEPRGIDGIFGPATRAAIRAWQRHHRLEPHGYLDREQVIELAAQAARRAAELEAEARERQAEAERRDRAFWRETGASGDEFGLRAYLDRYPEGIFASIARQRLREFDEERARAEALRDSAAWDAARARDTVAAYQRYLADHPQGAFVDEAHERIDQLEGRARPGLDRPSLDRPGAAELEAARAHEASLRLPRFTRVLVEQRLERLGYEPGAVDGEFDRDTRRAIRAYQRDLGQPATGYLTQGLMARLLAEGFMDLLD